MTSEQAERIVKALESIAASLEKYWERQRQKDALTQARWEEYQAENSKEKVQ